jgi:transposase
VRAEFERIGVEIVFLPPYSPDLNPIEMCWSKMKTYLRQAAGSYEVLGEAINGGNQTDYRR